MIADYFKKTVDYLFNNRSKFGDDVLEALEYRKNEPIHIAIVGKTHAGKSTLINLLFKPKPRLKVGVGKPGTEKSFTGSVELNLGKIKGKIIYTDVPGIGASLESKEYNEKISRTIIEESDIVIWLFRCFDTAKEVEQAFYKSLPRKVQSKMIFALSQVDDAPGNWYNKGSVPSKKQKVYIMERIKDISRTFNVPEEKIIDFSSHKLYNINILVHALLISVKGKSDILRFKMVDDIKFEEE